MKTITLKHKAKCRDCGADLHPGDRASYYGRGKVYGRDCHAKPRNPSSRRTLPKATRPRYPMVDWDREQEAMRQEAHAPDIDIMQGF